MNVNLSPRLLRLPNGVLYSINNAECPKRLMFENDSRIEYINNRDGRGLFEIDLEYFSNRVVFPLLIAGSREISNDMFPFIANKIDHLLSRLGASHTILIVEGGARGVDRMAAEYAIERGYALSEFPAEWDRYGKRAGYIRNLAMHEYISLIGDHQTMHRNNGMNDIEGSNRGCILFWNGTSRGTAQSINMAEEHSTSLRVIKI